MRTKIVRFRNPQPGVESPSVANPAPAIPAPDPNQTHTPEVEATVVPPPSDLPLPPPSPATPPSNPWPPSSGYSSLPLEEDETNYATEGIEWARHGIAPGTPEPPTGWLVIVKGSGKGRALPTGYGTQPVGRGEGEPIRLNFGDRSISRHSHFQITYDAQGRNFYASQGTSQKLAYVNGQPILHSVILKTGDRLRLGDTELVFTAFCGADFDWQVS